MSKFIMEQKSRKYIEQQRCPDDPYCPHCGSLNVVTGIAHKSMTHRCHDCPEKPRFSVRVGTIMKSFRLSYRVWALAIYLF